jgi:hypothetical protein
MDHSYNSSQIEATPLLSTKETMMYFDYTYAPNLTHQGAYVITEKLLTKIHTMVEENINTTQQLAYFHHLQNLFIKIPKLYKNPMNLCALPPKPVHAHLHGSTQC